MIDTVALREKVLDLAIRGKLVPQDPNDEPASVLLERIRAQKQQMVKDGKLKAKDIKDDSIIFVGEDNLHYEKFGDGTVECIEDQLHFELPEGWSWCRLSQIITLHSGQDLEPSRYNDVGIGIPYITGASNLENGKVIINRWTDSPTTHATTGDLLITCKGSGVGKMAWCNICDAHIARQIMALRCLEGLYSDYLEIVISAMLTNIKSKANGLIPGLSRDIILGIMFPLPPFEEQKLICSKCREVLSYIDNIDNQKTDFVEIINVIKSRILDFAIRGKLVPQNPDDEPASVLLERIRAEKEELIRQGKIKRDKKESVIFKGEDNSYYEKFDNGEVKRLDDELLFDIPESWRWCRLKDLFNVCSAKRVLQSEWEKEGIPFYRAREIVKLSNEGYVDNDLYISLDHFERLQNNYGVPQAGDLMVTGVGTIGKVYIVKAQDVFYYKDASVLCFENCFQSMIPEFAKMLMESTLLQTQIHSQTYGNTVDTITISTANDYLCVLPPLNQQQRIVEFVEKIYTFIESIEKSLA